MPFQWVRSAVEGVVDSERSHRVPGFTTRGGRTCRDFAPATATSARCPKKKNTSLTYHAVPPRALLHQKRLAGVDDRGEELERGEVDGRVRFVLVDVVVHERVDVPLREQVAADGPGELLLDRAEVVVEALADAPRRRRRRQVVLAPLEDVDVRQDLRGDASHASRAAHRGDEGPPPHLRAGFLRGAGRGGLGDEER